MRQIILDTETTGLEPAQGHRIIEIGCVEINHRRRTDRHLQFYINPEREIDDGAFNIHGISNEFLADKPGFAEIAQDMIDFIRDSELVIHNAPFDVAFLNAELERLGKQWGRIEDYCQVKDTLVMAREKHPGQKNSLDALCKRYEIDNSRRELHGALLDAQILVDVYLAMTGGQSALSFTEENETEADNITGNKRFDPDRKPFLVIKPDSEELEAHHQCLERIQQESDGACIWLNEINNET